jgi:hypothetical protein
LKLITEVQDFVEVGACLNSQDWQDKAVGALITREQKVVIKYKLCLCYSKEHRMAVISKWSDNIHG